MEKIYRAKDGKLFSGESAEKQCANYEKQLNEKELSRKALHEEVEKAKADYDLKVKQMQDSYKAYQDKMSDFCNKYGAYHTKITISDLFPINIFDKLFGE